MSSAGIYAESNNIEPKDNRNYYVFEYTPLDRTVIIDISEEQARTEALYAAAIRKGVNTSAAKTLNLHIFGNQLISQFTSKFYHSPYEAAGKYYVTAEYVKHLEVDRLTGKKHPIKTGYRYTVKHGNKEDVRTYWL